MDVGIKKIANGLIPSLIYPLKGINGTVGTTDVEEDLHLCKSEAQKDFGSNLTFELGNSKFCNRLAKKNHVRNHCSVAPCGRRVQDHKTRPFLFLLRA